jgi:hypothetical protein
VNTGDNYHLRGPKGMKRTPVASSNISAIGYDRDKNTLEIEFNTGDVYQYFDVPFDVYRDIMGAMSVGQYFAANVKFKFKYEKVGA